MKHYIGDGVYVEYDSNTYSIILTTENGYEVTNKIVLEAEVLSNLEEFVKRTIYSVYKKK